MKAYYDSCEQEIPYDDIKRRSDLKIWSKAHPEREPIYIEIVVTHPSEDAKLHCGSKIIEIKVENEQDIDYVVQNGFTEGHCMPTCRRGITMSYNTYFYGLKNEDYCNKKINQEITFSIYILYKSGKSQCYLDICLCKELRRVRPRALYEVCFHTDVAFGIYELAKWMSV